MNEEYIKKTVGTAMHVAGTVKMGPPEDKTACLDIDFRVRGLESLRVADMSIVPELIRYVNFQVFKLLLV
jgi:choline dehydrogenase-like flavoprotein